MAVVMSNSNTGSGGVRNLRAIFENKSSDLSTSPPSRGRSPTGSVASSHSRPLSKVRTSFVAVERSGDGGGPPQLGLRRVSSTAMSVTNGDSTAFDAGSKGFELGNILKGSPFEQVGTSSKSSPAQTADQLRASQTDGLTKQSAKMPKQVDTNSKTTNKPGQIQTKTTSPTLSKESPGLQTVAKPRGGPAKILAVMESAKQAREERAASGTKAADTERAKKTEAPKATSPAISKPPRASLPVKTTRPSGSATAPTASSAAKNDSSSPTEAKPADRKMVSRGPPRVANTNTASSLAKRTTRASLGGEPPKPRTSSQRAAADEGFLARMMRPTASSAQKTHEKLQVDSPPRSKATSGTTRTSFNKASRASLGSLSKNGGDEELLEDHTTATTPSDDQAYGALVGASAEVGVNGEVTNALPVDGPPAN